LDIVRNQDNRAFVADFVDQIQRSEGYQEHVRGRAASHP
jgi:hypothetical protein